MSTISIEKEIKPIGFNLRDIKSLSKIQEHIRGEIEEFCEEKRLAVDDYKFNIIIEKMHIILEEDDMYGNRNPLQKNKEKVWGDTAITNTTHIFGVRKNPAKKRYMQKRGKDEH